MDIFHKYSVVYSFQGGVGRCFLNIKEKPMTSTYLLDIEKFITDDTKLGGVFVMSMMKLEEVI